MYEKNTLKVHYGTFMYTLVFMCVLNFGGEMKKKQIDRGEIVKNAVEASELSIKVIIKKAGYKSTTSYYRHIQMADLSLEIVKRYGKALSHDFSIDIPEIKAIEAFIENENPKTIQEALKERDFWRDKYYAALEKNNELLSILNKNKLR